MHVRNCYFLAAPRRSMVMGSLICYFIREASGRATARHEDEFMSDHTGGVGQAFWRAPASFTEVCLRPLEPPKKQRRAVGMRIIERLKRCWRW